MKIAFVIQRYGLEVNGGAELHCRQIAEHLSKLCDVDVITSCAIDYMTWMNEYEPGVEFINGVKVHRFPVDEPRNIEAFNKLSEYVYNNRRHTKDDELKWMRSQGPFSSGLLSFIRENVDTYDYFIFYTYLYCTSFFGLQLVKDKAILVPTAHDEPPIYLGIFHETFNMPKAIIYNTIEEKMFVNKKFNNSHILSDIVAVGIDTPRDISADGFIKKYGADEFILYIGRIDESKGCKQLFDYFLRYKARNESRIKLILIGKTVMDIPFHKDIIHLGFLPDEDKFNAIAASKLMVVPSKYESLSMTTLEAWACGKAVLVNGECAVLKGHCIKSNGGLWYNGYEEFEESINMLLSNDNLRYRLGHNGVEYVKLNYNWHGVVEKYKEILNTLDRCDRN